MRNLKLTEYIAEVGRARRSLDAHARALFSSISERRRRLKNFEDRLYDRLNEPADQAKIADDISPEPALAKLIDNPTSGL